MNNEFNAQKQNETSNRGKSVLFVHPEHRKEEAFPNVVEMLQNKREYCLIPKDISELRLSEEKFYKVFQNSTSLIAITSAKDGRYIDVTGNIEVEVKGKDNVTHSGLFMKQLINRELENQVYLTDALFNQPSVGIFFMMLDEPLEWNDSVDKDKVMDHVFDHQRITKVNQVILNQYGAKQEDIIGLTPNMIFAADLQNYKGVWKRLFDEGSFHTEFSEHRSEGSIMEVYGDYICLYDSEGRIIGNFGIHMDVTNQKRAEEAAQKYRQELSESEERYRMIAESTSDVIWVFNLTTNRFTFVSPSVHRLLGYSVDEALELSLDQLITPKFAEMLSNEMKSDYQAFTANPNQKIDHIQEAQLIRKDGSAIWTEISSNFKYNEHQQIEIIGISRNIDEKKRKEEEIQFLLIHDPLTGLMNRSALRLLKEDLAQSKPLSGTRSVMSIDIDNFRIVNDVLGHQAGDQLIIDFAQKIISCIGDRGEVYHTGGDEFVIVFESTDPGAIQDIAKEILHDLANQVMINKRLYILTASIGVCIGAPGEALDQTIENSDTALYLAKKNKNSVKIYTREMEKARTRDAILEEDLRCALEKGQLELYFQPIYDVRKGVINQAEALLRWNHPEFGRVSPVEFIPIAERTKLILPITDWVIRQSCHKLAEWKAIGSEGLIVSVNLTLISFESRGDELTAYIVNLIKETGIAPSSLKLEITESTLIHDSDEIIKVFHDLKSIGVKLALDDFGTGYSSFGYMKDLPLDIIKLDCSLITDIVMSEKEQMIVSTMITIIHGLGLEVVVEGVETMEQYEKLKQYDCDYIQGFLFSRPLPADEFVKYYRFMKENRQATSVLDADRQSADQFFAERSRR